MNGPPADGPVGPRSVASRRQMRVAPVRPSASTFSRCKALESALSSTSRHQRAPWLIASIPRAPVPANRSSTAAPSSVKSILKSLCRSMLKMAWRVRSEVGRTLISSGVTSRRPPNVPLVIRIISRCPLPQLANSSPRGYMAGHETSSFPAGLGTGRAGCRP